MDFVKKLILLLAGTSKYLTVILSPEHQPSLDPKFISLANIPRKFLGYFTGTMSDNSAEYLNIALQYLSHLPCHKFSPQ